MSVPTTADGELVALAGTRPPASFADIVAPTGSVLVLAPHPDDETLGCGAAITAALAAGREVCIALLTNGELSHPNSKSHPRDELIVLRLDEFAKATARLVEGAAGHGGGSPPGRLRSVLLALADGHVPSEGAGLVSVASDIAELARSIEARTLWSTWAGDPHCDHRAASAVAGCIGAQLHDRGEELRRYEYAVWGRFGRMGQIVRPEQIFPFPPGVYSRAKTEAMAAYESQLTRLIKDDPQGFVMPPDLVDHFATHPEIFLAASPVR